MAPDSTSFAETQGTRSVDLRARSGPAFIRPGESVDSGFVERFNGSFRGNFLNQHLFVGLADERQRVESWRLDVNFVRPHGTLGDEPLTLIGREVRRF